MTHVLTGIAAIACAAWIYLVFFRGQFWRADQCLPADELIPASWPAVSAVVPARNEAEFARLNRDYEQKFGYVFLIFATGRSAAEMLEALQTRLPNRADMELRIAAGEQAKITGLRLEKLLSAASSPRPE